MSIKPGELQYGDSWLEEMRTAVLVVPSIVGQPIERNLIINPSHPEFSLIEPTKPRPVEWDERLHEPGRAEK